MNLHTIKHLFQQQAKQMGNTIALGISAISMIYLFVRSILKTYTR